jgi:hypothetical protein
MNKLPNLQPVSWGLGRLSSPDIITGPYNKTEQNRSLKISIGYILGNGGLGRGLIALHSFLMLKKGTKTSNQMRSIWFKAYMTTHSIGWTQFYWTIDKKMAISQFQLNVLKKEGLGRVGLIALHQFWILEGN